MSQEESKNQAAAAQDSQQFSYEAEQVQKQLVCPQQSETFRTYVHGVSEEDKKEEARIHDGNFKTLRPYCLAPEDCKDIEDRVRNLLVLQYDDKTNELAQQHAENQADLKDLEDYLRYYL